MLRLVLFVLLAPLTSFAAPVLPQTRALATLDWSTRMEGTPFVDGQGTAYFQQGCRLSDGTEKATPLIGRPEWLVADPSGIGAYGFAQGSGNELTIYRNTCTAAATTEGSTTFPGGLGFFFEPAYVDETNRACVATSAGLLCWQLPSGTPSFLATSDELRALLPPIATLRARSPDDLRADAVYLGVEVTSAVRSNADARTFMAIRIEMKSPVAAVVYARAVVELSANGLRLVDGPDFLARERATQVEHLFLDQAHHLIFASDGLPTHASPFLGSDGARYLVPPALNVYPSDGSPGAGYLNWSTLFRDLSVDIAVGAPRPKVIATFDGPAILKNKPNPAADPGELLYRFQIDWDRIDLDEDGLPAGRERALGTSDLLQDSDGGGISDAFEVARGTNPLTGTDDNPTKGMLPENVDYSVSGMVGESTLPSRYFLGGGFRPGKLYCTNGDCLAKMQALFDGLQDRVLTADGKAVIGFDKQELVVRSFDGSQRRLGTFPTRGLTVSLTNGGSLLFREGKTTLFATDGSSREFDLTALVCADGGCGVDPGNVQVYVIGFDRETETFRVIGLGNEEVFTFFWSPDRGLALVGRNNLMAAAGGVSAQLTSCQFTPEGACLGAYLISSGNSFPAILHGQTGSPQNAFRMLTNGYPQNIAWDTSFTGFAHLDTGRIIDTEWVRMEDRIEAGDVLTMEGFQPGAIPRPVHLYRIGKRGAMLPLYGDSYDPDPATSQTHFPGLPQLLGLGASNDGRLCLIDQNGVYRELASPDANGLPQTIGVSSDVQDGVDCAFDEAGRAHVLAKNPSRIIILDSRLPNALVETIPLTTSGTPSQLTVAPGDVDIVAQGLGQDSFLCLNTVTKVVATSLVTGVASAVSATYGSFILDDRYNVVRLKAGVCDSKPIDNERWGTEDVGPGSTFDLVVRPDGRVVANGSRQLLASRQGLLIDTAIQSRAVVGPLALVPGGAWTDPWAESVVEPDFGAHEGTGGTDGGSDHPSTNAGCGCGGDAAGWLAAVTAIGVRIRRRKPRLSAV